MVNTSETYFGRGSSLYGVHHKGYGSGGERTSHPTTTKPNIDQSLQNPELKTDAETRNLAAKAEIVAEVDRIQKRMEIRKGKMSDEDREVLLSLSKILKALDSEDSGLMERVVALLQS